MSDIYLINRLSLQLTLSGASDTSWRRAANWFSALCAKRRKQRSIAELRKLSKETLDDIGVDAYELFASPPRLIRSNPYYITFANQTDHRYFQVKEPV
jgi:uncharacterized protein YjiS (DUF1127 family)